MIEAIHIENFKALKSIDLTELPQLAVFVGKNGVGKTSLFCVLSFLKSCLSHNVRVALQHEGGFNGFKDVITRGVDQSESIVIQLKFYLTIAGKRRLATYYLAIGLESEEPVVRREILRYKRAAHGAPFHFIDFSQGKGLAVSNEEDFSKPDIGLTREEQAVDPDVLAVSSLGQLKRFKAATAFRELIENWHISDFDINQARGKKTQELATHLSRSGDNLPSVALHMKNEHSDIFEMVLQKVRDRVPGISDIEVKPEGDSLLIRYADNAFQDPFLDKNVSDGTIKMFAYLLLLHDPKPHKVLCVEEPESHLYPELMTVLAEDFQEYTSKGGQVFVSTHSPQFLNAIPLESLFLIEKSQGVSRIMPFTADPLVRSQMEAGSRRLSMGSGSVERVRREGREMIVLR